MGNKHSYKRLFCLFCVAAGSDECVLFGVTQHRHAPASAQLGHEGRGWRWMRVLVYMCCPHLPGVGFVVGSKETVIPEVSHTHTPAKWSAWRHKYAHSHQKQLWHNRDNSALSIMTSERKCCDTHTHSHTNTRRLSHTSSPSPRL